MIGQSRLELPMEKIQLFLSGRGFISTLFPGYPMDMHAQRLYLIGFKKWQRAANITCTVLFKSPVHEFITCGHQ